MRGTPSCATSTRARKHARTRDAYCIHRRQHAPAYLRHRRRYAIRGHVPLTHPNVRLRVQLHAAPVTKATRHEPERRRPALSPRHARRLLPRWDRSLHRLQQLTTRRCMSSSMVSGSGGLSPATTAARMARGRAPSHAHAAVSASYITTPTAHTHPSAHANIQNDVNSFLFFTKDRQQPAPYRVSVTRLHRDSARTRNTDSHDITTHALDMPHYIAASSHTPHYVVIIVRHRQQLRRHECNRAVDATTTHRHATHPKVESAHRHRRCHDHVAPARCPTSCRHAPARDRGSPTARWRHAAAVAPCRWKTVGASSRTNCRSGLHSNSSITRCTMPSILSRPNCCQYHRLMDQGQSQRSTPLRGQALDQHAPARFSHAKIV